MKFVDKYLMIGRFYLGVTVVDLFYREESLSPSCKIYPIFNADILHIDGAFGFSLTIPFMKINIGWISK